jgi:hypothetical protein
MGGADHHGHATFPPQPSLRQLRAVWVLGTGMWLFLFFRARAELPHLLGLHQHSNADVHTQSNHGTSNKVSSDVLNSATEK